VARDEFKNNEQYECLLSDERTVKDIILHISAVDLGFFYTDGKCLMEGTQFTH
jgi:hypothetical protein